MSYKLEQSIVPLPGTDTTVACDFEIGESSSKLPAFFPRKTKCTPARHRTQKTEWTSAKFSINWRCKSNNSRNQFYCSIVPVILLFALISNCIWHWHEANHVC